MAGNDRKANFMSCGDMKVAFLAPGAARAGYYAVPATPATPTAARPASRRATGTRNGEHDT